MPRNAATRSRCGRAEPKCLWIGDPASAKLRHACLVTDWSDLDTAYLEIFGEHPDVPEGVTRWRSGDSVLISLPNPI